VGTGIAVLHAWWQGIAPRIERSNIDDYHQLTLDLYVPTGDAGYWQGALRDPAREEFRMAVDAIAAHKSLLIDLLYGDHLGAQRYVTRFLLRPLDDGTWLPSVIRHWSVDGADPRARDT
jgi:hypothetical protein